MSGRADGGRDRFRKDYPSRYEDKAQYGHSNNKNPPSRHLWVGNLPHGMVERDLTRHFLQFGELESVAFQPSRSYTFINFKRDEEAIAAMRALQGFPIAGNPIRIEFAKADKSSVSSRDEDYSQHREEKYHTTRGPPFSQARHGSPDQFYPEKSKMNDKNAEPSEVLWIGFPASLKVDDMILRNAFSPFGGIEKITSFPGRTYAFVRFRSVTSAWRAKETLQGKLFGNPRVHICFAKNDSGSSNSGRSSMNAPLSPNFKSNDRLGFGENFPVDKSFGSFKGDSGPRSPHFFSNFDSGQSDSHGINRKGNSWTSGNDAFEMRRSGEFSSKLSRSQDRYEYHGSPTRERGVHPNNFPQRFSQQSPLYEDSWDLPEDTNLYHGSKKLKTGPFPHDKELPEYPLSDLEQDKRIFPKPYSNFPSSEAFDKKMDSGPMGYKQSSDRPIRTSMPYGENGEHWRESYDNFQVSDSLPSNAVARKRLTPDSEQSSIKEWKWEGTIAKGGTPVCRARCFPVGKVLDMLLPEFLDCTARTGLDMLSKHYYEAASAWVVFFVPEGDSDMVFYNEFMHYLGEKQRAAVSKLDDKTTLFLVPPSEFSEKVLKVPGKLSISGVILRLERPGSSSRSLTYQNETLHGDTLYTKPSTSSAPFSPVPTFPDVNKSGVKNMSLPRNVTTSASTMLFPGSGHPAGSLSDPYNESRPEYPIQQGPNWSSHHQHNSNSDIRNIPSQASNTYIDPVTQERHFVNPREIQETSSSHFTVGNASAPSGTASSTQQEIKPAVSLSTSLSSLPAEQLAQLASSLLGAQRQLGNAPNTSMAEDLRQRNRVNESGMPSGKSQNGSLQNNLMNSEPQTSQIGQVQQMQLLQHQMSNVPAGHPTAQREHQTGHLGNQQTQNSDVHGETEADPQKRLQATLQLAAALLQQIQQGK